jgi:metallophosphoesterase (TIGR03768 family)
MSVSRRHFLKYCAGSATVLGLEFSSFGPFGRQVLAAAKRPSVPSYPISRDVQTTLDTTVVTSGTPVLPNPLADPPAYASIYPCQISLYAQNEYGEWALNPEGAPYCKIDMHSNINTVPPTAVPDPSAATLLSFFTISDVHICDKESPAQSVYNAYQYPYPGILPSGALVVPPDPILGAKPGGGISSYSGIILYTTHVLDAAIQTINALHQVTPFDFGIALGDACDNTQYNELRWYLDVIDGGPITPSSGAHKGADRIGYQKPYKAAGLDKSISWYQAVGNHDQFWKGSTFWTEHLQKTVVGSSVLNAGPPELHTNFQDLLNGRGYLMGVVDGSTEYGDIINAGTVTPGKPLPKVAADKNRRALSISQWMSEFFKTTSQPPGHGFTREMIDGAALAACYTFYPRAGIPIKVIVLDDTDKIDGGAYGSIDKPRYDWLINELENGQAADELMIICAHIPVWPYDYQTSGAIWNPASYVTDQELVATISGAYSNVVLWMSGHVHRNAITPQPSNPGAQPDDSDYGYGFYEVETPSLRDFPQEFHRFEIVRNSDNETISILVIDVDPAVNPAPLGDGSQSPALISRSYSIAAQQIFGSPIQQYPAIASIDPQSGVCNAELVIQLSQLTPGLQDKILNIAPVIGSFKISTTPALIKSNIVILNNTVGGSTPVEYMASQSSSFSGAAWQPYSQAPCFTLSPSTTGSTTVYFKVKDGSGKQSAAASELLRGGGSV